jgi:hypothetical protein
MAKILKNVRMTIDSDMDSPTYSQTVVSYTIYDDAEPNTPIYKNKVVVLSVKDQNDADSLFAIAKATAEECEGI